jgi:spermidine/putrescine transport system ATP-binding protein
LKSIQKSVGTAFVHVTHDQEEAMALADHVVVMNTGRIEDEGPPEQVYARPATRFSATFMGESTIIAAELSRDRKAQTALGIFDVVMPEKTGKVHLAIRPEHVGLDGNVPAVVRDVVYQGSFKRIVALPVAQPELQVLCKLSADVKVSVGDTVTLQFAPNKIIVLKD